MHLFGVALWILIALTSDDQTYPIDNLADMRSGINNIILYRFIVKRVEIQKTVR